MQHKSMTLGLNTRVILDSPFGYTDDGLGAIVRNGHHGYVRSQQANGRIRIAFPGVRRADTYHRTTVTIAIYEWWLREATLNEVEHWDSTLII